MQQLNKHRERWFAIATSTEPVDRPRAEAAAKELAQLGGVKASSIIWVNTPEEGTAAWKASFDAGLGKSLCDSLSHSLRDSLWDSLRDSLGHSLRTSLSHSLRASLRHSLCDPLWDSLWDSLSHSLWDSLRDSLSHSLRASLRDSLWDSPWMALYTFGQQLGVEYEPDAEHKLALTEQLLQSCFACWIGLGVVVLCERPSAVDIQDGKLAGITWR